MAKAARSAAQTARHVCFIESINYRDKSDDRSEFRFSKWDELTTSLEFRDRRTWSGIGEVARRRRAVTAIVTLL